MYENKKFCYNKIGYSDFRVET